MAARPLAGQDCMHAYSSEAGVFVVLSDGAGGRRDARLAAQVTSEAAARSLIGTRLRLNDAIASMQSAHALLHSLAALGRCAPDCATTMVIAIANDDGLLVCSAGDSLAWLVEGGTWTSLTEGSAFLTPSGAFAPSSTYMPGHREGGRLVVASDGLLPALARSRARNGNWSVGDLVQAAQDAGSSDDISAVCVSWDPEWAAQGADAAWGAGTVSRANEPGGAR